MFRFLFFITLFFTSLRASGQLECARMKAKMQTEKSNRLSVQQIAKSELYDIHSYDLDLAISNLETTISGSVKITASTLGSLDSALFELHENLTIDALFFNSIATPYSRNSSAVTVPINLSSGSLFTLQIDYHGTPPSTGDNPMNGSGLCSYIEPRYGFTVTASLSEPFSAYEWWPCKQSLTDKADSCTVSITVPENCKAGSNGILTQIFELSDGRKRFEWKHRHPISYYLISVAVADYFDYSVYAHPKGINSPILVQNFIYNTPQCVIDWKKQLDEMPRYIELYSDLIGLYPFADEKYGHCMAPIGGGMEHQTMTTQTDFSKNLTAHELAHQWFGDNVTCGSWRDIWVNEGFATYFQYLMLEKMYPQESAQQMVDHHSAVLQEIDGCIYVDDTLNAARIFNYRLTYAKGAAFIHTLRFIIADDQVFFDALKNFQVQFAGKTAIGTNIKTALENASGINLDAVFNEWYFGEGYPTYSIRWNEVGHDLSVEIKQSCSASWKTPLFTNPLEISFQRVNQNDTVIRFEIDKELNTYLIKNTDRVINLRTVDPNNWIINRLDTIYRDQSFEVIPNDSEEIPSIKIFPNPTNGQFIIIAQSPGMHTLKLYDNSGRLLKKVDFFKDLEMDISDLKQGIYQLQLQSEEGLEEIKRIVKK